MSDSIVVQAPANGPEQLILLFHGVGSNPQNMVPLGQRLAAEFGQAAVISVASPDPCDMGSGYQWFSVRGITEENRGERIAATMPRFAETVSGLQKASGLSAAQTVLIGFSQGAIMALESTRMPVQLAGRVVSIAGRFAQETDQQPTATVLHFIHGTNDPVIDAGFTVRAGERLTRSGASATVDLIDGLGHGIDTRAADRLVERLKPIVETTQGACDSVAE